MRRPFPQSDYAQTARMKIAAMNSARVSSPLAVPIKRPALKDNADARKEFDLKIPDDAREPEGLYAALRRAELISTVADNGTPGYPADGIGNFRTGSRSG
jgi:hypothetical protein